MWNWTIINFNVRVINCSLHHFHTLYSEEQCFPNAGPRPGTGGSKRKCWPTLKKCLKRLMSCFGVWKSNYRNKLWKSHWTWELNYQFILQIWKISLTRETASHAILIGLYHSLYIFIRVNVFFLFFFMHWFILFTSFFLSIVYKNKG